MRWLWGRASRLPLLRGKPLPDGGGEQTEGAGSEKAPPHLPVGVRADTEAVMPERAAVARRAVANVVPVSGAEKTVPSDGASSRPERILAAGPKGGQTPGVQTAVTVGAFPDGAGRAALTLKAEAAYAGYGRRVCHDVSACSLRGDAAAFLEFFPTAAGANRRHSA